jgi:DUF4097 and DUF4098 domain-containing protein YvlB
MASPVQSPPLRPRRSLAGPVVLIVLGIVFLLGTMGVLHMNMLGHWFARYWPLLIILWGVIKLLEYQQAQREGTRAPGIGAGGVFLLIVLIVAGLSATQATRVNWGEIRDQMGIDDGDFPMFGHAYTYDDQLQQAFPAGASLRVNDSHGAVKITASTDSQIHVTAHKRINAESQSDADKINAGTKPQITVNDNLVVLNANNEGAGNHGVAIDLDVSLPRKASIVTSDHHGDVNVNGRDGDVDIAVQHGEASVADVNGKVSLNLGHSSARVSQVTADVSIQGGGSDVSVEDIRGALHLSGEFDDIKLAKIDGLVSFKSARTDMELSRLNGDLSMDSGDLRASGVVGPLRLITRSKDIRVDGISGDVRLQDENGAIELRMSKLGSMQVDNRKGDIQVYLPDNASFQLDARARGGEVESDFGDLLKMSNGNDQATATGTIGAGGPRVVLNNEHGTIGIRKGAMVAETPLPPHPSKPARPPAPPKVPEPTEN